MLWSRHVRFVTGISAALLAAYLAYPIAIGERFPIGPDGPLYAWWARHAEVAGLGVAPGRAGGPGLVLVLGTIARIDPLDAVTILGPVLAIATGLAAAAMIETVLGPDPLRSGAAALFVAAWAAYLAPSWLGNLAMAAAFFAAMALLGVARTSWRAVWGAAALLAAAGLSHRFFFTFGLAILAGVLIVHIPEALRVRKSGSPVRDTFAARLGIAVGTGAAASALGFAGMAGAPARGYTSQDAFLRRSGLRDLLADRFRERLAAEARRGAPPAAAGAALATGWLRAPGSPGGRFLLSLLGWWTALTLAGIAVLLATGRGQSNRLVMFAFFVPVAAAVGVPALWRRSGAWRAGALVLAAVLVGGAMYGWYRQDAYVEAAEIPPVIAVGRAVERLPEGTPLVFLTDTREEAAAFHIVRFGNVIRTAVPAERIPDVRLAVGSPEDFLAGRPTLSGDREHDHLSRTLLAAAPRPSAVLVVHPFNRPWFPEAAQTGTQVAPGVVSIGEVSVPAVDAALRVGVGLDRGPLLMLAVATLILLGLLGGGWARWALGGMPRAAAALAPSAGVAIAVLAAVAADRTGLSPATGGALLAGGLAGIGYLLPGERPLEQ